jgi:hypothetical protein
MKKKLGDRRVGSVTEQKEIENLLNNLNGKRITEVIFDNGDVINQDLIFPEKDQKKSNGRPDKFFFKFCNKEICQRLNKPIIENNCSYLVRFAVHISLPEIARLSYIDNRLPKPVI